MAVASLSVTASSIVQSNDQRFAKYTGLLTVSAFADTYPNGGLPLDSVLASVLLPTGTLLYVLIWSQSGSGYIYQRIAATGTMMILQVPPSGSLATAAPLQQLGSVANAMSGPFEDSIRFEAVYKRNS